MLQLIELQPQLIDAFSDLITRQLGLNLPKQSRAAFCQKILQRTKLLRLPSAEAYYYLLSSSHQPITENAEWRDLISFLSVTESYFFRDQGQFSLLRTTILPELIYKKQNLFLTGNSEGRSLKIWSAGCATGEEAYSLAILVKELIPNLEGWKISILGTDINPTALFYAQRGYYTDWSFRSVQSNIQKKYFQRYAQGWKINSDISKLVTFQLDNLIKFSLNQWKNSEDQSTNNKIDLILCRNVFIYFNSDAISHTLKRFHQALLPGGYLITGHTELYGQTQHQFKPKVYSGSIIYQPVSTQGLNLDQASLNPEQKIFTFRSPTLNKVSLETRSDVTPSVPNPEVNSNGIKLLEHTIELLNRKAYHDAIAQIKQLINQNLYLYRAYCLLAEAYANQGQYPDAIQACQKAFQYDPLAVEPLYLLAQIAQEQGDLENAKILLKRVIYLVPNSLFAYFELGCIYEQQGNLAKAERNWRSSLNDLKQLSGDAVIIGYRPITASDLQVAIEQKLSQTGSV